MSVGDKPGGFYRESMNTPEDVFTEDFVPHKDNPQRELALSLINTLGFKDALRFARERQWQGVIVQIYSGLQSGPA